MGDMARHEAGEQAEDFECRRGAESRGGEDGEGVLQGGEGVRAERPLSGQRRGQPRVTPHQRTLLAEEVPQVRAPVAGRSGRQPVFPGDLVDHQLQQRLLVGDVAVERHGAGPDPGRDRAHGDRAEPFGVGEGDGRGGDLGPAVCRGAAAPGAFGRCPERLRVHSGGTAGCACTGHGNLSLLSAAIQPSAILVRSTGNRVRAGTSSPHQESRHRDDDAPPHREEAAPVGPGAAAHPARHARPAP